MLKKPKLPLFVFLLIFIFLIFRVWFFSFAPLTSGDLAFSFRENVEDSAFQSFLWAGKYNLGGMSLYHWMVPYSILTTAFAYFFNISSSVLLRVFWLWPFLILSIFSSAYLFRTLFPRYSVVWLPAPCPPAGGFTGFGWIVYVINTYILMVIGGGQVTIAMAYAIAPLVLGKFIQITKNKEQITDNRQQRTKNRFLRKSLTFGLILAIQIMFDPRIAYITLLACGLYMIYQWYLKRFNIVSLFHCFIVSLFLVAGLHSYWLLPMLMNKSIGIETLGEAYTATKAVKYFSFASFSNTISLLHPNWPENIFGKIYFMRSEFLLIPVLVYLGLLFLKNPKSQIPNPKSRCKNRGCSTKKSAQIQISKSKILNNLTIKQFDNKTILFFSFLGLLGAFLAKGANPPFGGVYLWLFEHFPGMIMFRDPTKFYLLIAVSYSVLIPFSVYNLANWIKEITKNRQQTTDNRQ